MTPLYKYLKENGTTIYALPGAEEDINQQSDNYKMYFSKFILLNLPKSQTNLTNEPKYWDFTNFYTASDNTTNSYSDSVVNSLRNYVANQEVTIRGTKINDREYFYDNSVLRTNTEKIFWKWCKKLNLIDFEIAEEGSEYFGDLEEFDSNNQNDVEYFKEYLWKERETFDSSIDSFYESPTLVNKLEVEYEGNINYKKDDFIEFFEVENNDFPTIAKYAKVLEILPPSGTEGYRVIYDITYTGSNNNENSGYSRLVYNKLVKYIGEIQGSNNVVSQNISYDQVIASIADNAGETPDILFRTRYNSNYNPSLRFPILPTQYQPEIIGAENSNSPIVNNPSNYPGDQYAQYDNDDNLEEYTYLTSNGDINRRSGDYFGVFGDSNNVSFDSSNIDGITVDFDMEHYVKMNIINREVNNFDEFNTERINGEFPSDFEFNAVLWYYDVEDINGDFSTNLYGISFIDNPANELVDTNSKFPSLKKVVATNDQDGTAYQFSLNRHTKLTTENPQPIYTNEYVNNLFGFNLYNEALRRLVTFNDSASKIIAENKNLYDNVEELKQLIYTQSDLESINNRLQTLTNLIQLYNTNQMVSTDTIEVQKDNSQSPPEIRLNTIDGRYRNVYNFETSNLYNQDGNIPSVINVPTGKDFMVNIINDDTVNLELPDDDRLIVYLNRDLDYKQTVDFYINGNEDSIENKKLDILITYKEGNSVPVFRDVVTNINLPVYYNNSEQDLNTSYRWENINEPINSFTLNNDGETVSINVNRTNGLLPGDTIIIENVYFGESRIDAQFTIDSINGNNIVVDYTEGVALNAYINEKVSNLELSNGDPISEYNSLGSIGFNKGYKISITRVDETDTSSFNERYKITVFNI